MNHMNGVAFWGRVSLLLIVMQMAVTAPQVRAEEQAALPSGPALVNAFVEASGGREAFAKLHNRVTRGVIRIPAAGIEGFFTSYEAEPNYRYSAMSMGAMGTSEEGCDGNTAWSYHPSTGAQIRDGEELARSVRLAHFNLPLHCEELYRSVECTGIDTLDGRPLYRVELRPPEGAPDLWLLDQETHLIAREIRTLKGPTGDMQVTSDLTGYRAVDGILYPFLTTQTVMGTRIELSVSSIEHNAEIVADRFVLPKAVQEKLSASKTGQSG